MSHPALLQDRLIQVSHHIQSLQRLSSRTKYAAIISLGLLLLSLIPAVVTGNSSLYAVPGVIGAFACVCIGMLMKKKKTLLNEIDKIRDQMVRSHNSALVREEQGISSRFPLPDQYYEALRVLDGMLLGYEKGQYQLPQTSALEDVEDSVDHSEVQPDLSAYIVHPNPSNIDLGLTEYIDLSSSSQSHSEHIELQGIEADFSAYTVHPNPSSTDLDLTIDISSSQPHSERMKSEDSVDRPGVHSDFSAYEV